MTEPYTPEQRAKIIQRVVAGLSIGTPLAVICREGGMPCDDTVRNWADEDEGIARAIVRAREAGWDALAHECLTISNTQVVGEIVTTKADGTEDIRREDMLGHRKLQIETRMKLLAKWDPKRYGDKIAIGGADDLPAIAIDQWMNGRGPE